MKTSHKSVGSPKKIRTVNATTQSKVGEHFDPAFLIKAHDQLSIAMAQHQTENIRAAMAMLTPLQYANHVVRLNTLDLPEPFIPPLKSGRIEIVHVAHKKGSCLEMLDSRMTFYTGLGTIVKQLQHKWTEMVLRIDGDKIASTSPLEVFAQKYVADQAHGEVLIGGLGVGLVLHELATNAFVKTITCVENDQELIHLLAPYFPKVNIVNTDIHKYLDSKGNRNKFDFIYIDVRSDSEGTFYDDIVPMRLKSRRSLRTTSSSRDIVFWMEEVMRGQVIEGIHNAIATKHDILSGADGASKAYREFVKVNVDFFKKYGLPELTEETTAKVIQFVKEWGFEASAE